MATGQMMRVLVPLFLLCANLAHAAPACEDASQMKQPAIVECLPSAYRQAIIEEQVAVVDPDRKPARFQRPPPRPEKLRQIDARREEFRERGAVCGDWTIIGENRASFTGKYRGCGITKPVRIRAISDVLLSQLATMDCRTAVSLKTWLENTAKPIFEDQGGGLKGLRLSGHYACKTQNNQRGARISEHARGRAVDISSFILMDGTVITVRDGWADPQTSGILRDLHAGACGIFGTVLGPEADRYHAGHFHFDTARRPSGPYCR